MSKTIHVRDFAGIKDVTLHPSGNLVVIAGNNGAGKSSLLNAVAELFNSKGVKLFPRPIREGADEAYAEYVDEELGLRISRTWKVWWVISLGLGCYYACAAIVYGIIVHRTRDFTGDRLRDEGWS